MPRILVVDDETLIRGELRRLLTARGWEVAEAGSVPQAREYELDGFDVILCDMRLPGAPGTELLPHAGPTPVVMMTSYATVKSAVGAMKAGAADYLSKPFDPDELQLLLDRLLREARVGRQNAALKADVARVYPTAWMVDTSAVMRDVYERIRRVAAAEATVLILGESGTGKELVARAIHEQSPRRDGPLVTVNCAAIPESLLEAELFGHEKGAFTGATASRQGLVEAAAGGTLFLDEIGELGLAAQARLLRVLQESEVRRVGANRARKVDVRLLAATHRNLPQMVRDGAFREDLWFRLRVLDVRLPPLRDRGEDTLRLADRLLELACRRMGRPALRLSTEARIAIEAHRWPGNVRELENAIERAVILADGPEVLPDALAIDVPEEDPDPLLPPPEAPVAAPPAPPVEGDPSPSLSLRDYFRRFVEEHQGTLSETELARRLGISRKALWERRARFGIPRPK